MYNDFDDIVDNCDVHLLINEARDNCCYYINYRCIHHSLSTLALSNLVYTYVQIYSYGFLFFSLSEKEKLSQNFLRVN